MKLSNQKGSAVVYSLCAVAGLTLGVLGTLLVTNGGGNATDPIVAEVNGKSVRASEAFGGIKTRLFDLEEEAYRTKEQAVTEFVEQKLLDMEAKKQNMSIESLVKKEMGETVEQVTDEQVTQFLASKGISPTDPRVRKEDVKNYLQYRKQFEKRQAYVQKLKESGKVKLMLKEPESPKIAVNIEGYPSWGNAKAPVTIVEFSDYQCPYCSRAVPILDKIKAEYGPDKVRIVFRDVPLPSHPRAVPAALAAHCANDQGKFWEFHNSLFNNQSKLEDVDLKSYAKTLGLDEKKFTECYDSKKHQSLIEKSKNEAAGIGIQATPSFLINGKMLQGAQPFERFKEKIDRAIRGA